MSATLRRGLHWAWNREERAYLAQWLSDRVPHGGVGPDDPATLGGVYRRGRLRAVVAFHDWQPQPQTLQASIAGDAGWATRGALKAMLAYAFITADARLLWATVPNDLPGVIEFNRRLGFQVDATLRERFGPERAAVVMSMTREEWQRGPFFVEMD